MESDVIYFGSRIVIPTAQHFRLLQELHYTHIGIVRMKETVRQYFWWPRIVGVPKVAFFFFFRDLGGN